MAFSAITMKRLGPNMVRISSATLLGNTSAVIGLAGDTGADHQLPDGFATGTVPDSYTLSDLMELDFNMNDVGGGGASHVHVSKSEGPFRITCQNDAAKDTVMEMYLHLSHSLTR